MVEEIYVCDGLIKNSKWVLMIDECERASLTFYLDDTKIPEHKPRIIHYMRGSRIEYGQPDNNGVRAILPFYSFETGELNKRWERIK
jgi:hypothetical protein